MAPIRDWDRLRWPVARLIKGIVSPESQETIQAVRQAITHAILSGQSWDTIDPSLMVPEGPQDTSPQAVDRLSGTIVTDDDLKLADTLRPADDSTVVSQRVILRPSGVYESTQLFIRQSQGAGLVPVLIFGPLTDALGRHLELAVFKQSAFTALRGGFFINTTTSPTNSPYVFSFGACTLWTPASTFVPIAPANGYFGLRVKSGTVTYPPAQWTSVTVELVAQSPWEGTLATRFSRSVPSTVTFAIGNVPAPVRGNLSTSVGGTAIVFGNNVNLHYAGGNADYDTTTARISFPLTADTTNLILADVDSDLVHFSGSVPLVKSAWSLPVVVFPTQGQFSPVSGNGAISMMLGPGLRSRYLDDQDTWTYGAVEVAIDETIASISGTSSWTSATRNIEIWIHGDPRSQGRSSQIQRSTIAMKSKSILDNPLKRGFPFKYVIQANGQESWSYSAALTASLGSPVTVDGIRTSFIGIASVLFTRTKPGLLPFATIETRRISNPRGANTRSSYLMENLLISTSNISSLFITGQYSWGDRAIVNGSITLPASLQDAVPTLPDPYVTNIRRMGGEFISAMCFQIRFDGARKANATVQLPPDALRRLSALASSPFDTEVNPDNRFKLPASKLWDKISAGQIEHSERYTSLEPFLRNEPAFLDVSTNLSYLGMAFSPQDAPLVVRDMTASTNASKVKVFCPPAVQWEAVHMTTPTGNNSVRYPSTGISTKMTSDSVTLVPVAPRQVLDETVSAYNPTNPGSRSQPISIGFQLPFGALARAKVDKTASPKQVKLTQPAFEKQVSLASQASQDNGNTKVIHTGAPQIGFRSLPGDESRGFPGTALMPYPELSPLPNFITSQFNQDFAGLVPLTGFDIAGHGASMFSAWQPTTLPLVGISKVALDVVVGRTAREVVQMISILYPYGVKVIRTVTILRLNNGSMVGQDSGWLAASDGYYDFGQPASGQEKLKVHRGLVKGVRQVTNIKSVDTSDSLVTFDCYMDIEGSENGALVPAQGQVGYIVTRSQNPSELPTSLAATAYAEILRQSKLGGPVDAVAKLGDSNQSLRVSRVQVDTSENTAQGRTLEFGMELWGTPVVPGGGQWAFTASVEKEMGKIIQQPVDTWGVPLIRKGLDAATSATSAIRVAGAAGLFSESSIYSLIHSADSHRLMFPAPELLPATAGEVVKGLTSKVPLLADGFALATSAAGGIFPAIETCIPLDGASNVLQILDGGHYEYKMLEEGGKLALNELERTIRQDGNFASVVSTVGKILPNGGKEAAYLDLAISTVTGAKDMKLSNLSMITQGAGGKELSRVVGSVLSSAKSLPIFQDAEHLFGELLGQVQKVVNFLNKLKVLPPLKVSMTNEWALEVSTSMGLDDFLQRLGVGEGAAAIKEIIQVLNFALKARTTPTSAVFTMSVDVTIKIPTGLGPSVLGVGGFKVRAGTEGNVVEMTLGAGIGVEMKIGPFGASAYYSQSQSIIISKELYGVAATCVLKVHVNLVVATADLLLEARLGLIGGPCTEHTGHTEDTIYAYAQVRIALHVSIFLIINCSVDETAEWENKMNSGVCLLEKMKPMA